MFSARTSISVLTKSISRKRNCDFVKKLITTQQVRCQTNAAAAELDARHSAEWEHARPFEQMPTERPLVMIARFLPGGKYYQKDISKVIANIRQEYGDIFYWPGIMGMEPMVVTHNVDDIEKLFRNEGTWPNRRNLETISHHRAVHHKDFFQGVEGLIATSGEKWATFRSAVNPVLMKPKNLKLYVHRMSEVNLQLTARIKAIRDSKTLEVPATFENELNRWALESVSVVALDKQLGLITKNRDNPAAKELFIQLTAFLTLAPELEFMSSLWRYFPTRNFKKIMHALDRIEAISLGYINEAFERFEEEQKRGVRRPETEQGVLEKLLKIDKKIATVMAMDMLMAGVDTTTTTLVACLLCLAQNLDKQEKLREEVMRILPNKDSHFRENALNEMPYLRACRKEAMRIHPIVLGNARSPPKDIVLSGYRVPKGSCVLMQASCLFDDNYFPRAKAYIPERWLRPTKDSAEKLEFALKSTNPFLFLPFGFGPRSCIGKRIAEMEVELGLARIIRNFKVEYNHPAENPFKNLLINVPSMPLTFKFTDV